VFGSPSVHHKAASKVFGTGGFRGDGPVFDHALSLLAFTNRSGSNLLAGYMRDSGAFSPSGEFLNAEIMEHRCKERGITSFDAYIEDLVADKNASGRIFGLKASGQQIALLHEYNIFKMFTEVRVVHCQRHDVIGQAVSFSIAYQTKKWTSRQKTDTEQSVEPKYLPDDIEERLNAVLDENQEIIRMCSLLELPKVDVCYEELDRRPKLQLRQVFDHFGLDPKTAKAAKPRLQKQRDALNDDFAARFRAGLVNGL